MVAKIEDYVYLSNLAHASCHHCLDQYDVHTVLTIDSRPLTTTTFDSCVQHAGHDDKLATQPQHNHFFELDDVEGANVLDIMQSCLKIIADCVNRKSNILVHCLAGVSRSATIVIAYVMASRDLSFQEAFEIVKAKKVDVMPNPSFIYQLKVFERMGKTLDGPIYKSFIIKLQLYRRMADQGKVDKNFWNISDSTNCLSTSKNLTFKCRSCRVLLFTSKDLSDNHIEDTNQCTSLHISEPLDWMTKSMATGVQGKLFCSKCNSKIGMFNWSGRTCSCGTWITPSFQIQKSRVDQSFPT